MSPFSLYSRICTSCLCSGLLLPDPTCPWGLGMRWYRVNDTDSGSKWETLQQALIPSTCASLVPRKHLFYSSSWLAHIIRTSNPCSLRQSSIRSSCGRCLYISVQSVQPLELTWRWPHHSCYMYSYLKTCPTDLWKPVWTLSPLSCFSQSVPS